MVLFATMQARGRQTPPTPDVRPALGQALIDAKQSGGDPFAAIEAVMSWDAFAVSVTEAQKLAQPDDFGARPVAEQRPRLGLEAKYE